MRHNRLLTNPQDFWRITLGSPNYWPVMAAAMSLPGAGSLTVIDNAGGSTWISC
jgi:hypothetical protein